MFYAFFQALFSQEARKFTDIHQLSLKELQLPLLIAVFWVSVEVLLLLERMISAFKLVSNVIIQPVVTVRIKLKVCDLHNYS
jgi:hypothetical protein